MTTNMLTTHSTHTVILTNEDLLELGFERVLSDGADVHNSSIEFIDVYGDEIPLFTIRNYENAIYCNKFGQYKKIIYHSKIDILQFISDIMGYIDDPLTYTNIILETSSEKDIESATGNGNLTISRIEDSIRYLLETQSGVGTDITIYTGVHGITAIGQAIGAYGGINFSIPEYRNMFGSNNRINILERSSNLINESGRN